MHTSKYNQSAPKKATNLSINSSLLQLGRSLGINLSQTLEEALIEQIRIVQRGQWLKENQSAIENYNDRIEKSGVFSDGLRRF